MVMMQKTAEKTDPCHILPDCFIIRPVFFFFFQKSERSFFGQVARDAKSVLTFENPLMWQS